MADMAALGAQIKSWLPANGRRAVGKDELAINLGDYADMTGASDSSLGVSRAIAKLNTAGGGRIYIPSGRIKLASTPATIGVPCTIEGAGAAHDGSGRGTAILTDDGVSAFRVDAHRVNFRSIYIQGPEGSTTTATKHPIAIDFLSGAYHTVRGCRLLFFHEGIKFRNCDYWTVAESDVSMMSAWGIFVSNAASPDAGDSTLIGNTLRNAPSGAWYGAGVRQESSGGVKSLGNKYIEGRVGYEVAVGDGVDTSVLTFSGDSFETHRQAHIRFTSNVGANTGHFGKVTISGNQFSPWNCSEAAVSVNGVAGQYQGFTATGNNMSGTRGVSKFFSVKNVVAFHAIGNSLSYGQTELVDGGGNDAVVMDNMLYDVAQPAPATRGYQPVEYYKNDWTDSMSLWGSLSVYETRRDGANTVKLATGKPVGSRITVANTGAGACTVSSGTAGQNVGPSASYLVAAGATATFLYAGSQWIVIAKG